MRESDFDALTLREDLRVALQFVRELAELSMLGMSDPRERDLILRARKWLHTETERTTGADCAVDPVVGAQHSPSTRGSASS